MAKHLELTVCLDISPPLGIMLKNLFFNFTTGNFEDRQREQYCTTYLDQLYKSNHILDDRVIRFIKNLCNKDNFQIELLRHHFKNIRLRRNPAQVAFFYMEPAMTGKSTWSNFLMYVMTNLSAVGDIARLSGKFNTHSLKRKSLLALPDVDSGGVNRTRAAILKSLTCGELVTIEPKHDKIGMYTFKGNIILNGNTHFDVNEEKMLDGTGLARRLVVLPCNTAPDQASPNLFNAH